MSKIGFVIVTYQRCEILKGLLDIASKKKHQYDIVVTIMDASDDKATEQMVLSLYRDAVSYYHYPNTTIGERVLLGVKNTDAEYICICGDSVRPVFENYPSLIKRMEEGFDLIDFSYRNPQHIGTRIYTDIVSMYKELTWDMTQMGNVFFRKGSYSCFSIEEYRDRYHTEYFIQNAIYFDCFAKESFRGFFCNVPIISVYQKKKPGGWSNKIIEVAAYGWDDYVQNSLSIYDNVKDEVGFSHGVNSCMRFNHYSTFIKLAVKKQLTKEIFDKYKDSIERTSPLNVNVIKLISRMHLDSFYFLYLLKNKMKN